MNVTEILASGIVGHCSPLFLITSGVVIDRWIPDYIYKDAKMSRTIEESSKSYSPAKETLGLQILD